MEFASETVVKASLHGYGSRKCRRRSLSDGRSRPPHLNTWRDGWRHLRFLLLYSPRWLFFNPGLLLMAVGLLVGLWLLPGPRIIGNITFDVHTLLYTMAATVIGFQSVIFAIFTKASRSLKACILRMRALDKWFRFFTFRKGTSNGCGVHDYWIDRFPLCAE